MSHTNMLDLKKNIIDILQLDMDIEKLESTTLLVSADNDLGLDSLDIFELVASLEDIYEVSLVDINWEMIKTIGDLHIYIDSKMKEEV